MAENRPCTHSELIARVVAIESGLAAFKEILQERDERYKQRAISQDQAVKAALDTSEKAITKAETATEKRFEGVNEFRETLADQAATLMPRVEYAVQHKAITERIEDIGVQVNLLRQDLSSMQARGGGMKEVWGYIIAIAALLMAAVVGYLRH